MRQSNAIMTGRFENKLQIKVMHTSIHISKLLTTFHLKMSFNPFSRQKKWDRNWRRCLLSNIEVVKSMPSLWITPTIDAGSWAYRPYLCFKMYARFVFICNYATGTRNRDPRDVGSDKKAHQSGSEWFACALLSKFIDKIWLKNNDLHLVLMLLHNN